MKFRLFTIISFIIINSDIVKAQNISDSTKIDTVITELVSYVKKVKTQEINLSVNYDFSSYLNNAFLVTYLSSGYIDKDLKVDNLNRLNGENNPLGMSSDIVLQYRKQPHALFGNSYLGFSAAIEWHSINEMLFTDDFYSLIFFGTKQFAGKEAAGLHNVSNNNLKFYQVKGGLYKKNELRNIEFGFQVALNIGNQYSSFKSENASLYVDSLGKYIDLEGKFLYLSTEVMGNNFTKIQGYGASIDLYYQKEVQNAYKFRVDIKNLGFIYWNKNTRVYNHEESIHFEGIEIDNIFDNSKDFSGNSVRDSLINYINHNSTNDNLNVFIPTDFSVFYRQYFSKYFSAYGLINYRMNSLSDVFFLMGADYQFSKKMTLGGNVNYGDYSKFNIGVNLQVKIKPNFAIELQSRYLTGIIYNSFSGIGAFVQLNYKF